MKKRLLAILLTLILAVGVSPVALADVTQVDDTETMWNDKTQSFRICSDYWTDIVTTAPVGYVINEETRTLSISSAEGLVWFSKEINGGKSFAGYNIEITNNIDLSGYYWTPIDTATIQYSVSGDKISWTTVEPKNKLNGATIDGNGYTITGLATATGIRGPAQPSEPGDGQNCYYYAAFIGRNDGTLTIENLTFDRPSIAITEPAAGVASNATSMTAAVVANNGGNLTLNGVEITNGNILAMQKAAALVAYNTGHLTVNKCAATGNTINAYFQLATVIGYSDKDNVTINSVKLENNDIVVIEQQGSNWSYKVDDDGNQYYMYAGDEAWSFNASEVAVFTDGQDDTSNVGSGLVMVAEVNGYQYATLADAIDAAEDGGTVTLIHDVDENVVIPADAKITLNLNGYTLTNAGNSNTITNNGTLTVTGDGTVDNTTHGTAALYNDVGATATLNGGTFTRSKENGINKEESGSNSYYTILNHGTMIINAGVTVNQGADGNGKFSSLVENGWYSGGQNTGKVPSKLTINGGSFSGGLNTIKNDDWGELTINGGSFYSYAQACLLNWNVAEITGGKFDGSNAEDSVVLNGYADAAMDQGLLTVTGGNFVSKVIFEKMSGSEVGGSIAVSGGYFTSTGSIVSTSAPLDSGVLSISGGYFSSNPKDYVAEGNYVVSSDKAGYGYMVSDTAPTEVPIVVVDKAKGSVSDSIDETTAGEIESVIDNAAVSGVADAVTESGKNTIVSASGEEITDDSALVEVSISVSVTATSANLTEGEATVTYEVKPTATVSVDGQTTCKTVEVDNSYLSGKSFTVRLPLPNGLDPVEIMHVADNGARERFVTGEFTVGNGWVEVDISHFSTITVSENVTVAAKIGAKSYGTLQEAVNAAKSGDIIVLEQNCTEPINVEGKSIRIDRNGKTYDAGLVTAGKYCTVTDKDGVIKVTYSVPTIPTPNGITVTQPANGNLKVNPSNGSAGTLITVTATPDKGYELAYVTVDGKRIEGTTFRMSDHAVTVSAVFVPVDFPFTDVKSGDWFYDYVAYVYSNGLMDGTSATTFEPNANMTRAMVWAILARIDGETVTGSNWADTARTWAMAEGVSDGTDPNGIVTREQFATMLYRYAVAKGYDVSIGEDTNILSYADFDEISEWAIPAIQWACGSGIITGVTDTTIVPQGSATRAQCAAMLMRFVENV